MGNPRERGQSLEIPCEVTSLNSLRFGNVLVPVVVVGLGEPALP